LLGGFRSLLPVKVLNGGHGTPVAPPHRASPECFQQQQAERRCSREQAGTS